MTWVWGLTGSPTPNEPTDAWGQCKIVTPHTVPKFFGAFRDQTMIKITNFTFKPRREANEIVHKVMQPAVRFTLDDVTELPEVVEQTLDVKLGPLQEKVYEGIRKQNYAAVASKTISAVNAGALLNKMLQISMGYVYSDTRGVVPLDSHLRLDALCTALASTDRKVLVFVPFTHALDGIYERLLQDRIDCAMVHGATPKRQRDKVFSAFQNTSKYKVIVAHPVCMSHGLTLTAADTIIWYGPTTSLETFEQANARIRRVGQKHKQLILMLQSSAAEKRMYARLRAKQNVQDNLLAMFEESTEGDNPER
jgi:SNF2 family DNA or RNA helicase